MPGRLLLQFLFIAAVVAGIVPARGEDYPPHPIRLIVTTPAGSLVDVLGRMFAEDLGTRLGQNLFVDNRPGGMTQIGVDALNRAARDGYTLMIGTSEATMLPFLKKTYRYDPLHDFTPIALLTTSWTVFAINPKVPATTLAQLVDYARSRPGGVRYGTGGVGGAQHIAVEMLRLKTGADFVHVPYRGGAQAAADAIAGQIEMVSMGLASTRVADNGQLRILAQTGPVRHPMLPDVPTTAELGFPDVRMDTWFGLVGPPELPEAIVARLARESEAVVREPSFRDKLVKIGCEVAFLPAIEFKAFIAGETAKWQRLVPAMGLTLTD